MPGFCKSVWARPPSPEGYDAADEAGLWGGCSAYDSNRKANAAYNGQEPGAGRLGRDKPVLLIHANFDFVCATLTTRLADPMREACESLNESTAEAGHNVHFEKPEKVNAAVARSIDCSQRRRRKPGLGIRTRDTTRSMLEGAKRIAGIPCQ